MSHYFVTCIGRSGSLWLAHLLNQAADHECRHEDADTRSKVIPQPWTPFPVNRWTGKNSYGEVNGMLRYHLSAQHLGAEMQIPHRIYLRRSPLDIIASWMTQGGGRDETELSATCHEVLWHAANLAAWAEASASRIIDVEALWRDREWVQTLVDWLDLDLLVTPAMMAPRNAGQRQARLSWVWTDARLAVAARAAERAGHAPLTYSNLL